MLNVSLYLDRAGATDGFFADFAGWSTFGGIFTSDGIGNWQGGTESPTELTGIDPNGDAAGPDSWTFGRRPGGISLFGTPLNNGSFRFPNASTNVATYQGGSTLELDGGGNFEGFQAGVSLGNQVPDTSDRIEVFRTTLDISGFKFTRIARVDFVASSLAIGFDDLDTARSVLDTATISPAVILPAPGAVTLIGLAGVAARRRR